MATKTEQAKEQFEVKRYKIQYPISAYTFPQEARIHRVSFDNEYLHVEFKTGESSPCLYGGFQRYTMRAPRNGRNMKLTQVAQ